MMTQSRSKRSTDQLESEGLLTKLALPTEEITAEAEVDLLLTIKNLTPKSVMDFTGETWTI
jgi:hypothetical protein